MRSAISQAPARLRIIRICRGLQTLRQSDDHRRHTSSGGDTGFTAAAHRFKVDVLQVGADRCGIRTGVQVQRLVGVAHSAVLGVHLLGPPAHLLLVGRRVMLDHHIDGCAVIEELALMPGHRLIGLDLTQDRRQPRHAAVRGERIRDGGEVRHLIGQECRRIGAGHPAALGVHVPGFAPTDLAASISHHQRFDHHINPVGP